MYKKLFISCILLSTSFLFFFPVSLKALEIHIVYTNDIHDHIRPGYNGQGGMPYIAGFVKGLKEKTRNILVVDAGDLTDKGDMVADYTNGELMFVSLEKIGYDVVTLGNHDLDKGLDRLCKLKDFASSVNIVTTNWKKGVEKCFNSWSILEIGGYKIGFIGIVKLEGSEEKVISESLESVNTALNELKEKGCNFVIALSHLSSKSCLELSKKFPDIDLFVSGHTHELLRKAKVCEDTGAIVVQAGMYGLWIGVLKLLVDTDNGKVLNYENNIVDLKHSEIQPDLEFLKWVVEKEKEICPIASKYLIENKRELNSSEVAMLACRALLLKSKADVALFHPRLLVRSTLPMGKLDYNAIYMTAGHRAKEIGVVVLKGRDIEEYMENLVKYGWGRTMWDGFKGLYIRTFPLNEVEFRSDLDLDRVYKVVVSKREWEGRLKRSLIKSGYKEENLPEFKLCSFTYFDAVAEFIENISDDGKTLDDYLNLNAVSVQIKEEVEEP